MFGHDHVTVNAHRKALTHLFQAEHKQVVCVERLKLSFSAITTEGEEVGLSGLVRASQTVRHDETLHPKWVEFSRYPDSGYPG